MLVLYVEARSRGEKERMDVENDTVERERRADGFVGVEARRDAAKRAAQ